MESALWTLGIAEFVFLASLGLRYWMPRAVAWWWQDDAFEHSFPLFDERLLMRALFDVLVTTSLLAVCVGLWVLLSLL